MDYWVHMKQAGFYVRKASKNETPRGITLLEKESCFWDLPGDASYKIDWIADNYHYECEYIY